RQLVVRVATHQRRQVEGDTQTGPARPQESFTARVRFFRRAEAGELTHRPELSTVSAGIDAARVGQIAWIADVAGVVDGGEVIGRVQPLDRPAGNRGEGTRAF